VLSFRFPFTALFVFVLVLPFASAASSGQSASPAIAQTIPSHPASAVASETAERTLRVQWRRLFDNKSWTKLDSIASRLRSQRLRFQGGGWQLHVLYTIVSAPGSKAATNTEWGAKIAALKEWMRHDPSSPTPRIALADAYEHFAWKARGSGFADTVTPEGWNLFGERIQKAREVLEQAEKISRGDPEWYDAMLVVAFNQDWSPAQVDALADEALSREPGYFYIARELADDLLPKWDGAPGDTERFAGKVADRIGGAEGDATYFFIAEQIQVVEDCEDCSGSHARGLSWTRIRRGYAAVERLYGTNNFERNAIAYLALRANDFQTAQQAFERVGNNWDKDVWASKAQFDHFRRLCQTLPNLKPMQPAPSKQTSTAY
jgi:hypothetical protein